MYDIIFLCQNYLFLFEINLFDCKKKNYKGLLKFKFLLTQSLKCFDYA